jgi:site-specific recombinase XerD
MSPCDHFVADGDRSSQKKCSRPWPPARAGVAAKFTFPVHSHMLRHACGFKLANDGHDTRAIQAYLGHRSIMSTVRYTALTPNRFKHFWKD